MTRKKASDFDQGLLDLFDKLRSRVHQPPSVSRSSGVLRRRGCFRHRSVGGPEP